MWCVTLSLNTYTQPCSTPDPAPLDVVDPAPLDVDPWTTVSLKNKHAKTVHTCGHSEGSLYTKHIFDLF